MYDLEWSDSDNLNLYVDASQLGMGGTFGSHWFSRAWTQTEHVAAQRAIRESMPYMEATAVATALSTWGHMLQGRLILLHSDCLPVVDGINHGWSRNEDMMTIYRFIACVAWQHNLVIRMKHIEGRKNIYADLLSRLRVCDFLQIAPPYYDRSPTPAVSIRTLPY